MRLTDHPTYRRINVVLTGAGPLYTALYAARRVLDRCGDALDRRLVAIEQHRRLVEPWTASARRFTTEDNKRLWNTYDWSALGEEWTPDARWKSQVVDQFLAPHVPVGGVVLEIGPGGGRWTEVLQKRASWLHVVDVAERAIDLCRERFGACANVHFHVGDGSSLPLGDESIDAVWSYDVFVHINPVNVRTYFTELRRVLKRGGRAVIHHPGDPTAGAKPRPGWRSDLTTSMILGFAAQNGFSVISQTRELVNQGDLLTVFEKALR